MKLYEVWFPSILTLFKDAREEQNGSDRQEEDPLEDVKMEQLYDSIKKNRSFRHLPENSK